MACDSVHQIRIYNSQSAGIYRQIWLALFDNNAYLAKIQLWADRWKGLVKHAVNIVPYNGLVTSRVFTCSMATNFELVMIMSFQQIHTNMSAFARKDHNELQCHRY